MKILLKNFNFGNHLRHIWVNNYFIDKIENIRLNFNNPTLSPRCASNTVTTLDSFKLVTIEDIKKQIHVHKIKTSTSDPIPVIVHLINTSLSTGSMDGLKESIVTPILKKAGLDQDQLSNYRPVCSGMFIQSVPKKVGLAICHFNYASTLTILGAS